MTRPVFKITGKKAAADPIIEVRSGEFIFHEGDLGTDMFIVHEGEVEILQRAGGQDKKLARLEKGDFFGEMSLLEDLPRAASARAAEDSKLLRIDSAIFSQMLRDNPEIAVRMMRKLSRRLRETDRLLKESLTAAGSPDKAPTDIPTPEVAKQIEFGPEKLIHEKSQMEFQLSAGPESTIGRKDPVTGIYPEIDITPVDSQRSVSRRHAKIYRRGNKFFLAEEIGTMNGTFANGTRLETGVPVEIGDGDEVRLGMVVMTLKIPS